MYRRVGRREMMVFRLGLTASEAGQILGRRVGPEPLSYGWSEMRSLVSRTDLSYPARFQISDKPIAGRGTLSFRFIIGNLA